MKVLVFGPSGAGKTYIATALKSQGVNAFDDGDIPGLSSWYSPSGKKVSAPLSAKDAIDNKYAFLWSKKALAAFLSRYKDAYIFGGSGNTFDMIPLFDKVYFLKIDPELQRQRILNSTTRDRNMDMDHDQLIIWGSWLEDAARQHGIPMISAALTVDEIWDIIK